MLRLWPKEVQVGLFAGHCWLRLGRTGAARDYVPDGFGADAMLMQLALMLDDPINVVPKGANVVLTVSDALAAVLCMQWQPTLHGAGELRRYAEICFERQGRDVEHGWLLTTEYRQYEGSGMAYGFPAQWIGALERLLHERGLHLLRVLPASAALYCAAHPRTRDQRLSLLVEAQRISVLSYSRALLEGFDVEPVTDSPQDALRRLLRRASGPVAEVGVWSSNPAALPSVLADIKTELPDARFVTVARERLHSA